MPQFSPDAMGRIQRVVPIVERSMRNTLPRRARWHGGGGASYAYFELRSDLLPGGSARAWLLEDVEVPAILTSKGSNTEITLTVPETAIIDDVLADKINDEDERQYVDVRWSHDGESAAVIGWQFAGTCEATAWDPGARQLTVETSTSSGERSFADLPDPEELENDLTTHVFFWNYQRRADPEVKVIVRDRGEDAIGRGLSSTVFTEKNGDRVLAEKKGDVWYLVRGPILGTAHNVAAVTRAICQAGEIIGMKHTDYGSGATVYMWPETPESSHDNFTVMPERAFACEIYTPNYTPVYANWAVALKECNNRTVPAAVGGLALAKLSPRFKNGEEIVYDERWYADVHPDPRDDTRDDRRLTFRSHGRARILRLIRCKDSDDVETMYALIDMNQSKYENVLVVAKDTITSGTQQYFDCYGTHALNGEAMLDETLRVYCRTDWLSPAICCLGQDTVDAAGLGVELTARLATRFIASYHPGRHQWYLQHALETRIPVMFQSDYDANLPADVSVKFAYGSGGTWHTVGNAFDAKAYYSIGWDYQTATVPNDAHMSINAAEGDIGSIVLEPNGLSNGHGIYRKPVVDATPFLDAPMGTIRLSDNVYSVPPGWGLYQLDKLIMGAGSTYDVGNTGTVESGGATGWHCLRLIQRVAK